MIHSPMWAKYTVLDHLGNILDFKTYEISVVHYVLQSYGIKPQQLNL